MMSRRIVLLAAAWLMVCGTGLAGAQDVLRIGVLANRGIERARQEWQPTADYLSRELKPVRFVIVPLGFAELLPAVMQRDVDYLVANSAYYAQLEHAGLGRAIATRVTPGDLLSGGKYGGIIFTRADRADLKSLSDLRGKSFSAVSESSFGGWQVAWRELVSEANIQPGDLGRLVFAGTHDQVVFDVLRGAADAGTIRSSHMERMASEGRVSMDSFKILHDTRNALYPDYPYWLSTRLYPEWPFAALSAATQAEMNRRIAIALISMPADSLAAEAAGITGWSIPQSYDIIHDLLRDLGMPPYDRVEPVGWQRQLALYGWPVLVAVLLLLAVAGVFAARMAVRRAVAANERKHRTLLEHAINAIAVHEMLFDDHGRPVDYIFLDANPAFERMTGVSFETIRGRRISEVMPAEDVAKFIQTYGEVVKTGVPRHFEDYSARLDRHFDVSAFKLEGHQFATAFYDISVRVSSEQARQESDLRFQAMFEGSSQGIVAFDLQSEKLAYANPVMQRLFGYTGEEFTQLTPDMLHPVRVRDRVVKDFAALAEGQLTKSEDLPCVRKDGSEFIVDLSASPVELPDRRLMLGFFTDVTARYQARGETRAALERLDHIVNSIAIGVYVINGEAENLKIDYISPRACDLLQVDAESALKDPSLLVSMIHPDERDYFIRENDRAYRHGLTFRVELRFLVRGVFHWFRLESYPLADSTGKVDWYGTIQDIHAERQAEEDREGVLREAEESRRLLLSVLNDERRAQSERALLFAAIEHAVESVVISDALGNIQYVNRAFEESTGYTRDEAMGQNPRILKSGQQDAAFYREMWETLAAGKVWSGRLINKRKNGDVYTESATIASIPGDDGKITHYVAVKRDISRELEVERQLQQSQRMEVIGQLAGGMAHDFNNLLQSILGFSDLALKEHETEENRLEYVKIIRQAGETAASLTRQLLAFSRRQVLQKVPLSLNQRISNIVKMTSRMIGENIHVELTLDPDLPLVMADPGQVEQVIMNLAVNARDAMPKGGTLSIRTERVRQRAASRVPPVDDARKGYARLVIADTGIGMPPEIKDRVFEPFFTTKKAGKGTGLGLSTVYGIVKQHNGWIDIVSEPGKGTEFHVFLPVADEETIRKAISASKDDVSLKGAGQRILLVEDEYNVRLLMKRILSQAGFVTIPAGDGQEAVKIYEEQGGAFDLVCSDVIMPGMNGFDLIEELTRRDPAIGVVMVSGYTDEQGRWERIAKPGWVFVHKPVDDRTLLRAIQQALRPAG